MSSRLPLGTAYKQGMADGRKGAPLDFVTQWATPRPNRTGEQVAHILAEYAAGYLAGAEDRVATQDIHAKARHAGFRAATLATKGTRQLTPPRTLAARYARRHLPDDATPAAHASLMLSYRDGYDTRYAALCAS